MLGFETMLHAGCALWDSGTVQHVDKTKTNAIPKHRHNGLEVYKDSMLSKISHHDITPIDCLSSTYHCFTFDHSIYI
jgi:hypothetical protein